MATRNLLKTIFFPVDFHRRIFDDGQEIPWKTGAVAAAVLAVEAWILVMALEYWWWGQVYIKSGLLVFGAFYLVLTLPATLVTWRPSRMFQWHAIILVVPTLIAITSIVLLRFGILDPDSDRYLYRIPGLMVAAGSCIAWVLSWKIAGYVAEFKEKKPAGLNILRIIIGIVVDVACIGACALLLLNIEWVFALL
ncbi:MAG: hypothetical protein Q6373_023715 [Candidatus Sigynarchaeota archaeon]